MPLPRPKVLIVDADAGVRSAFADQLRAAPVTLIEAADGNSAWSMLNGQEIGLVVSELHIPVGSDSCLVTAIGKHRAFRRTRVLVHTALKTTDAQAWARTAGADGYLIRPATQERVQYVVDRLVGDHHARGPAAEPPGTTVNGSPS